MVAMNTTVAESAIYDKVADASHLGQMTKINGTTPVSKSAIFDQIEDVPLLREYDDGAGWPKYTREKEQAFRQGFLEEAQRVVREWAHSFDGMKNPPSMTPVPLSEGIARMRLDPLQEAEAARHLRLRVRERYAVYKTGYGPGCAGRKTYHLGYRPGHEIPAARLRGRHHALEYVIEPTRELETADVDVFDPMLLSLWLKAVEEWADRLIRPRRISPPPRLLEVPGVKDYLIQMGKMEPDAPSIDQSTEGGHGKAVELGILRTVRSIDGNDGSHKTVISESPTLNCQSAPPSLDDSSSESSPSRRIQLTRADQIEIRPPEWFLYGIIERDSFAQIFGDPGCGKSFLAIDWSCRIATGTPWRNSPVKPGPVVYIAGEGQRGFGRRIRAWQLHNNVSLAEKPLYLSPAVAMPDPADLLALTTAIDTGIVSLGSKPVLIVLDTLARNYGDGDENATKDMSRFVAACDKIRNRYDSTVLVVHHTGHAEKSRARGALALKAALDAEYRLTKSERLLLTATKMKDAEMPEPLGMELVSVELPGIVDDFGNPVTSAAIGVLDADTSALVSKANAVASDKRGKWQKIGLEVARRLIATAEDNQASVKDWHVECDALGMRQSTRYSVLAKLHTQGEFIVDGETIITP